VFILDGAVKNMMTIPSFVETLKNLAEVVTFTVGGLWAWLKIKEYRQFKNWIQLDENTHIFKLNSPVSTSVFTWNKEGERIAKEQVCTHAVETLLKFTNRGPTRLRLFNIQVGLNTMRPPEQTVFDEGDGHLHMTRIFTSGNLVPEMPVKGKPVELTSFYYIEPHVSQTISFCTLIPQPRELLQVFIQFSLAQQRIFPKATRFPTGLYPHTAAKTYKLNAQDSIPASNDAPYGAV
jgi:hypothetical protein